jgi:hypothetical protein
LWNLNCVENPATGRPWPEDEEEKEEEKKRRRI